jgi:hypothetical protein
VLCSLSAARVLADEHGDAMALIIKEYPAAAKKLDDAYSHVRAIGKITGLDAENNNTGMVTIFDQARKADAVRSLITVVKSPRADMDRSPQGLRLVEGGTADLYFEANKYPDDANYKFFWYGPRPDFVSNNHSTMPELYAVTCLDNTPVAAIVTGSSITSKSASFGTFEGKKVVTIKYAGKNKDPGQSQWHSEGTIRLVEPSMAILTWRSVIWDVTSRVAPEDQGLTFNLRVEYSQLDPVPKVSKVERWRSKAGKKLDHTIIEVKELDFGDLPDAEFHLPFYDIPKPDHLITPGVDVQKPELSK